MSPFNSLPPRRLMTIALALVVGVFLGTLTTSSIAAQTAGTVVKKRADVYGTAPGESRERKYPRYDVVHGELIETSGGAAILIRMIDKTELFLGERARMTIDDFVYDPGGKPSTAIYNFTLGTLRFISGQMDAQAINILTPSLDVGMRGSEAIVFVTPDGGTILNVLSGTFLVRARGDTEGPEFEVGPNQNISAQPGSAPSAVTPGMQLPSAAAGTPSDFTDPSSGDNSDVQMPDFAKDLDALEEGGGFDKASEGSSDSSDGDGHPDDGHGDDGGH